MNGKQVIQVLNGKKIPIALVSFIIATSVGYGELKNKVSNQGEEIKDLKPITAQVARIEENVENIDENFKDFRNEQRIFNRDIDNKLGEILEAVLSQ